MLLLVLLRCFVVVLVANVCFCLFCLCAAVWFVVLCVDFLLFLLFCLCACGCLALLFALWLVGWWVFALQMCLL